MEAAMDRSTELGCERRSPARYASLGLLLLALAAPLNAGEVSAVVNKSGDLLVTGGADADSVLMVHVASSNAWFVTAGAATTSINGVHMVAFQGVGRDVVVDLGGGDDHLDCAGAVERSLRMRLGAGADSANVHHATIGMDLRVLKSADRDEIEVTKCDIGRDVRMDSGAVGLDFGVRTTSVGRDLDLRFGKSPAAAAVGESVVEAVTVGRHLRLKGASPAPIKIGEVTVAGSTVITATAPNAVVAIDQAAFASAVDLRGPANLSVSLLNSSASQAIRVNAAKGPIAKLDVVHCVFGDDVRFTSNADETLTSFIHPTEVGGDLRLDIRSKTSTWSWLSRLHVVGDVVVKCKGAPDTVVFTESNAEGGALFSLGGGENDVSVSAVSVTGNLSIKAGKADDEVTFFQVVVGGESTVATGAGTDTFVEIP
jgi:hypothetical protein